MTIRRNDKVMAQICNNLSHPLSCTLNQQAVDSIPTRPPDFFNHFRAFSLDANLKIIRLWRAPARHIRQQETC